jgi:hypothetical protein
MSFIRVTAPVVVTRYSLLSCEINSEIELEAKLNGKSHNGDNWPLAHHDLKNVLKSANNFGLPPRRGMVVLN